MSVCQRVSAFRSPSVRHGLSSWLVLWVFALSAHSSIDAADRVLIPLADEWSWLPGLAEASSPDTTAWRARAFDDSAWRTGALPIGYGDGPYGTDLSQEVPPMEDNYSSVFLRHEFEVIDVDAVVDYRVQVDWDDGFAMWINGVEVLRVNVRGDPADPLTFDGRAGGSRESGRFEEFLLPSVDDAVVPGQNVLAVQLFNTSIGSSDSFFDVELVDPFGPDLVAPLASVRIPGPGATVRRLTRVSVRFDEPVIGVDASDLLLDGVPASNVVGGLEGPWEFTFEEPAPGDRVLSWSPAAAITDTAPAANVFVGEAWNVTLDPDAPTPRVVISEVLSSNRSSGEDEDGRTSDWIEIHNDDESTVQLAGWSLSDDAELPGKWTFPSVSLAPDERLLVFASGESRSTADGELHANFSLAASGEYIGLFTPEIPPTIVSEYAPLPPTRADHSYGVAEDGSIGWFAEPTPLDPNAPTALIGFVEDITSSRAHGLHSEPFDLELTTVTPGATIWFTLDGSEPTPTNGSRYVAPLRIEGVPDRAVVTLRAAGYASGRVPSRILTQTHVFTAEVTTQPDRPDGFPLRWGSAPGVDYGMDPEIITSAAVAQQVVEGLESLPTLSIVTDTESIFGANGIYSRPQSEGVAWERACSAEWIPIDGREGFQVDCGLRIFGGASRNPDRSPKHSLRLLFKGIYGPTKLRYSLFEDSAVREFDTISLRGNYNNSWIHWDNGQRSRGMMLRDQWAKDTTLDMGQVGTHGGYANVYLNGLYWGVYNVVERPSAPFAAAHQGGDKEEYDALNSGVAVDGNATAWSRTQQAVNAVGTDLGRFLALDEWLDVGNLIDYMILNFYGANADWDDHNWYAARRRVEGGQWRFFSWDAERILESPTGNRTNVNLSGKPSGLHQRLRALPEYRRLFGDHVERHLANGGALTPDAAAERFLERADEIEAAVIAESARWGDYRRDVHQSSNGPYELYGYETHWLPEKSRLLASWFPQRTEIFLRQLRSQGLYPQAASPELSRAPGTIQLGDLLELSLPDGQAGAIWYTLDGTDPRVFGTGEVSPTALLYDSPIDLGELAHLRARTLDDGDWSALVDVLYSLPPDYASLAVTEVFYAPADSGGSEFIEVSNLGARAIDLSGVRVDGGIEFRFLAGAFLEPGESLVLVADDIAFANCHPDVPIAGVWSGKLDNGGERFRLETPLDETILSVAYDDGEFWPLAADGFGRSLVLDELGTEFPLDDPRAWRASAELGGSPGMAVDPEPALRGLRIDEVLASLGEGLESSIEVLNVGSESVSLADVWLSDRGDDPASLQRLSLAAVGALEAGGHHVVAGAELQSAFRLSALGGEVWLSAFSPEDGSVVYLRRVDFGAAPAGVSYGVVENAWSIDFEPLVTRALGSPNGAPIVGPVVINEIQYHPLAGSPEFIELLSIGSAPVDLGAGWQLGGVRAADDSGRFEFPPGTVLQPGELLLIAPILPAEFLALVDVPAGVQVLGPWSGALDNGGELLRLWQPIEVFGFDALLRVDRVRYDDGAPWPEGGFVEGGEPGPDGGGPSLERVLASSWGNDPENWAVSLAAPGTPGARNDASPVVEGGSQRPGDIDQDGVVTLTDAVVLLGFLFQGSPDRLPCGEGGLSEAGNRALVDINGDREVNLSDPITALLWLFSGGAAPALGTECVELPSCPMACGL